MKSTTLITGADGYIGSRLAAHLLANTDEHLILAVHASSGASRPAATATATPTATAAAPNKRVSVAPVDLTAANPFAALDPGQITRIVHAAAVTRFNVPQELARAVNVVGTARLAAFAARCENLERFAVLSTLHTAGLRVGDVSEKRHDYVGFANNYEWSKWLAEDLLLASHTDVPRSVLRLPTVIAEDERGGVTQFNAFHNTLRLYYYGLLSLLPGDPACPLHIADAAFVISAIAHLIDPAVPPGVYHVTPSGSDVAPLDKLVDTVFEVFESDHAYRRRGLPRPLWCDRKSFDDLVEASRTLRAGPVSQAVDSIASFAAQLFLPKSFRNDRLREVWPGYRTQDPVTLTAAVARDLVASRWGRNRNEER
jgi:nucleoside-diphosphate-sugar epimerase